MLQTTNGCATVGAQFRRYFLKILPNSLEKIRIEKSKFWKNVGCNQLRFWCCGGIGNFFRYKYV